MLAQLLSERLLACIGRTSKQKLERLLRNANQTITVVDKARIKTSLYHFEPLTIAHHQGLDRHTDVIVDDLAASLGQIVAAKHVHGSDNFDAGRVGRYNHQTRLLVRVLVGCRLRKRRKQVESAHGRCVSVVLGQFFSRLNTLTAVLFHALGDCGTQFCAHGCGEW